jgi:transposase InsO family protein
MAMERREREDRGAGDEAGSAAEAPAPRHGGARGGNSAKRYSVAEKRALLEEFEQSGEGFERFCARRHVSSASLCKWRRQLCGHGEAGLAPRPNRGNAGGTRGRERSPDERRRAVEAFAQSGMSQVDFSRAWGLSRKTLQVWLARYRERGPKGLERQPRGPRTKRGRLARTIPDGVRAEIARTKQRFPDFGLKRVRDFLSRFMGVRVSTASVARVLDERGVPRGSAPQRRKRRRSLPRRFERARPGELWQTDITSFVIGRSRLRVYLIVFLDDCSRFVVSHGLYVYQRAEIAREVLMIGVGSFGKPEEVLSDQGRQYFAWRGKSDFQKLLAKQGIHHAVARAHHPETVGKCERLWETIKREFLDRVELEDLADARERLAHFIAHYNFFRPHQGIGGLVPADRYFGAEVALRRTHEARLAKDELSLALAAPLRTSAYLFGQIGDEQVSVSGERGRLVVHTSSGLRRAIGLDVLGAPSAAQGAASHGSDDDSGRDEGRTGERAGDDASAASDGQEAAALRGADRDASGGAGAVASGAERRAGAGAPHLRADPLDVAGQGAQGRSGGAAGDSAAARVAAQPASPGGYARGPVEAAPSARGEGGDDGASERRGPAGPEEEDRAAGAAAARPGGLDPAPGRAAQGLAAGHDDADDVVAGGEKAPRSWSESA